MRKKNFGLRYNDGYQEGWLADLDCPEFLTRNIDKIWRVDFGDLPTSPQTTNYAGVTITWIILPEWDDEETILKSQLRCLQTGGMFEGFELEEIVPWQGLRQHLLESNKHPYKPVPMSTIEKVLKTTSMSSLRKTLRGVK